jgi:TPR repeat protein
MKQGEQFMAVGDVAAARIVFRRAAEAGDAAAALAMGTTYDPLILKRMGALGVTPDPYQARSWYERAKDFGSSEAPRRIEMLANR